MTNLIRLFIHTLTLLFFGAVFAFSAVLVYAFGVCLLQPLTWMSMVALIGFALSLVVAVPTGLFAGSALMAIVDDLGIVKASPEPLLTRSEFADLLDEFIDNRSDYHDIYDDALQRAAQSNDELLKECAGTFSQIMYNFETNFHHRQQLTDEAVARLRAMAAELRST